MLDDPYLEYCKVRLSKEKKIFTFGCSFELDSHILDAIFEPLENKIEKKEIYFGFYSADDKERIEEYIRKNKKMDGNITYVDVSDVVSINDIVWQQQ